MTVTTSIDNLASILRDLYAQEPGHAVEKIETYLANELMGLDSNKRLEVLDQLESVFCDASEGSPEGLGSDLMDRLVPLLLGGDVSMRDLRTPELLSRLARSLNTIFNTLNDLIHLINSTLGGSPASDETIRHIIGGSLEGEGEVKSIEEYLGQIRKAFLTAQLSSKEAAHTIAGYILTELDPKVMDQGSGVFRIGPLKKVEAFDLYEERYERVKKWFESDRFFLDFLRQFEKNCQKSFE